MIKTCTNPQDLEFRKLFSEVCDGLEHKKTLSSSTMYLLDLFKDQKQTLIVFEEDSKCIGRILVTPKVDDAKTIFFGMVEYPKDRPDVAFELYEKAKECTGEYEGSTLVGPIDYSTWFSNRFKTQGYDNQYSWEPNNPLEYFEDIKKFGFKTDKKYTSKFFPSIDLQIKRSKPGYDLALENGFSFRKPDLNNDSDIEKLYELNTTNFKDNYLYSPITLEEYKKTHILSLHGQDLTYSTFIVDPSGVPQGYIYSFLEGDCLIIKSILISKTHQGALLSSALVYFSCLEAFKKDIKKGAGVLIREGNISSKFYEKIGEPYAVHDYELFKLEL